MRQWNVLILATSVALLCSCAGVKQSPYVLSVSGVISSPHGPESGATVELVGLSINDEVDNSQAEPIRLFSNTTSNRAIATTDEWGRYDLTLARFDHGFVFTYFPPLGAWLDPAPDFALLIKLSDAPGRILRVFSHEEGGIKFTAYDSGGTDLGKAEARAKMIGAAFETRRTWTGLPIQGHASIDFEVESQTILKPLKTEESSEPSTPAAE